jgi:hypothetical protein
MVNISEKDIEKIKEDMSEENIKSIKGIEKYIKLTYDKDLLKVNTNSLIKYVNIAKKQDGSDYSDAWKKKILFALKEYYSKLNRPIKAFKNESDKYFKKMRSDELDQVQTEKEKENYLTYDELNILLKEKENYKTEREMNMYIILASICTDQPPLRPYNYGDLNIVYSEKDITDDNGENYLYIGKTNSDSYIYINYDKVYKYTKTDKKIYLEPRFFNIIKKSLEFLPRKKLLVYDVKKPEKKITYELQAITGNKFNFDMARSSYINNWLKITPNIEDPDRIKLAQQMRHTISAQMTYYVKKKPISGNLEKIKKIKKDDDTVNNIDKIRSLISMANKRGTVIKEETIVKYGIEKNNRDKYYLPKNKIK